MISLSLLLLSGCASIKIEKVINDNRGSNRDMELLLLLDECVIESRALNASNFKVPGVPFLRTNRFLDELKKKARTEPETGLWIQLMNEKDIRDRRKEIGNLTDACVKKIAARFHIPPVREKLTETVTGASERLLAQNIKKPPFREYVRAEAKSSDDYSLPMRFFGYPIASLPVIYKTGEMRDKFRKWFETPYEKLKYTGNPVIYTPGNDSRPSADEIKKILLSSVNNSLGVFRIQPENREKIVRYYAPFFAIDTAGSYDLPGTFLWKNKKPEVETTEPSVYYYLTETFIRDKIYLQINYTIWFTGREGPNAPRIERGRIDGLTIRITIDKKGQPLMLDGMNNCGCYHFFVPSVDRLKVKKTGDSIGPFVPQKLPETFPGERVGIRIYSGWHQVQRILTGKNQKGKRYTLRAYGTLESLEKKQGQSESIFNSEGIMKDTFRYEFLLFFPMGIHDVGEMRQRGHHPIKLVGRAHFDDGRLIERNFSEVQKK